MSKAYLVLLLAVLICKPSFAGKKINVLFIGNSYTFVNNMPQIVADIATSMGDTVVWDMNAIGGAAISDNYFDPGTITKIAHGGWNYVVLQCQSEETAMPEGLVGIGIYPYVTMYDSSIALHSPCSETVFYMTWGRKNGDSANCALYTSYPPIWPYFCDYERMDSIIRVRYMHMAAINNDVVSPVGAVRHYIRHNYPSIELYQADESHPTEAGSYAAACSFYTTFFRKDPSLISYNYSLSSVDAANIRAATKSVVYDSLLYWHIGQYKLDADFSFTQTAAMQVNFSNTSANAVASHWDFGDGHTSTDISPIHNYTLNGTYMVTLAVSDSANNCTDTVRYRVNLSTTDITGIASNNLFAAAPNPVADVLHIYSSLFTANTCTTQVTNMLGQVVYSRQAVDSGDQAINMDGYPKGVYLATVAMDGTVVYRARVVKE